jgi:hypothetical protein
VYKAAFKRAATGNIDAEAVDAQFEPEVQDILKVLADNWVIPVEIGLLNGKEVEVPLAEGAVSLGYPFPGGAAEDRLPVIWWQLSVLTLSISKDVALALR